MGVGFLDKIFGKKEKKSATGATTADATADPPVKSCSTTTTDTTGDPPVKSCSTTNPK